MHHPDWRRHQAQLRLQVQWRFAEHRRARRQGDPLNGWRGRLAKVLLRLAHRLESSSTPDLRELP